MVHAGARRQIACVRDVGNRVLIWRPHASDSRYASLAPTTSGCAVIVVVISGALISDPDMEGDFNR